MVDQPSRCRVSSFCRRREMLEYVKELGVHQEKTRFVRSFARMGRKLGPREKITMRLSTLALSGVNQLEGGVKIPHNQPIKRNALWKLFVGTGTGTAWISMRKNLDSSVSNAQSPSRSTTRSLVDARRVQIVDNSLNQVPRVSPNLGHLLVGGQAVGEREHTLSHPPPPLALLKHPGVSSSSRPVARWVAH